MKETTWIIDTHNGSLTVEGLHQSELKMVTSDLLPTGKQVNCARPINTPKLNPSFVQITNSEPSLRVFRIYHHSVVEGPGRRSVLQTVGCSIRCDGCIVPETHDPNGGVEMPISEIVEMLLDSQGEPRDGITILGGEPFLQLNGLLALMQALRDKDQHLTVYTGYTIEQLISRSESVVRRILELTDILIDGPFIKELSEGSGEWVGSTNQRLIYHPSQYSSSDCSE
ncbi:MAG: radical SAM protein [Acidobacteria bacterium]|nr:radical SAM protein [Acidobacteriota bacterium]